MECLDTFFTWKEQEETLFASLFQSEERAMAVLEKLEKPLPLQEAARCLKKALRDCSAELFHQILLHTEPGECIERYGEFEMSRKCGITGDGSLLLLAAMLDRPRQAQLLLEHGYDCNGAGLEMAASLQQAGQGAAEAVPLYARFCGSTGNRLGVSAPGRRDVVIRCATPLAAALLCGSRQTAEVLLQRREIWKEESSAVCRAAVMVLEGMACGYCSDEQRSCQLEILRQIFWPEQKVLPEKEALLRSVYLQPAAFVDFCSSSTLRCQLESGLCTEEDARRMLELLGEDSWRQPVEAERSKAGKLLLLKRYFPKVCREGWAAGIFLREILWRIREELPHQTLLTAWKQLCGKERDLTEMSGEIWALPWAKLNRFLQKAGEGGALVMDADAMNRWYGASGRSVETVMNRVRIRARDGKGVNGFVQQLLHMGNLKVLLAAEKKGLLACEDPKLLMEQLMATGWAQNQDIRATVLTYACNRPAPGREVADWQDAHRWPHWCLWEDLEEEQAQALLQRLLRDELPREECLRTIFRLYQYMDRGFFAPDVTVEDPRYPALSTNSLLGFACCAESSRPLELLMAHLPRKQLQSVRAQWGEQLFFQGTPLTLAAALGRTEQVRLLLEQGEHPDEPGRGDESAFHIKKDHFYQDGFPVTPVLAAILFGQEETVKLLLEAGAVCDFSRRSHRRILHKGGMDALRLAESLEGVGFEAISPQELESIRFAVSPKGARGVFWACLQSP